MEKQFVTYDIAFKLNALGLKENGIAFYDTNTKECLYNDIDIDDDSYIDYTRFIKAPLWQEAFDWLEKNHKLFGWVSSKTVEGTNNTIYIPHGRTIPDTINKNLVVDLIPYSTSRNSYDAKKICLEHLIGIVESRLNKVNPDIHRKQQLLTAYSIGKTIQYNHSGKWEDFVPQNQVDRPNFDYGNIDNWRIKP